MSVSAISDIEEELEEEEGEEEELQANSSNTGERATYGPIKMCYHYCIINLY